MSTTEALRLSPPALDLQGQDPTEPLDRIEKYLGRKHDLHTACNDFITPIFRPLGLQLAQAIMGAAQALSPDDDPLDRALGMFSALGDRTSYLDVRSGQYIDLTAQQSMLETYEKNVLITLVDVRYYESGLDADEVDLVFDCDAWDRLMKDAFDSSLKMQTSIGIWLHQPRPNDAVTIHNSTLSGFDLADLELVHSRMEPYWQPHLAWASLQ